MQYKIFGVTSVIVLGSVIFLARFLYSKRRLKKVGVLAKVVIYPIKSVPGIELQRAECTEMGLRYEQLTDRQFLLVDDKGTYISHYEEPSLALLKVSYHAPDILVQHNSVATVKIPTTDAHLPSKEEITIKMRIHTVVGVDCGEEARQFFQTFLGRPDVKLVRFLRYQSTPEQPAKEPYHLTAFHNWRSYHLLSQPSLDDLNTRLPSRVTYKNFRPNFVIDGCEPYDEDCWKSIQLGEEVVLSFIERNFRCLATCVNPEKGVRADAEPYKTLSRYRVDKSDLGKKKYKLSPLLGTLLAHKKGKMVQTGDSVYAVVSETPLL